MNVRMSAPWTLCLVTAGLLLANAAGAQETFRYAPPGVFPSGSGRLGDRTVYLPDMGFPLQVGSAFGDAHAFANSQIHPRFGSANDRRNYAYPWHDTYCETRSWNMPLCPGKTGHQGVDIQPASPEDRRWPAVAMDDGIVTGITRNTTLTIRSTGDYSCRYLHLDHGSIAQAGLKVGSRVRRGDVVGRVSNVMGGKPNTSIHLHFDCFRVIDGRTVRLPVYSSLISAYRRSWGLDPLVVGDQLGVDPDREAGASAENGSEGGAASAEDPSFNLDLPKSLRTRNFGAVTPQTEMANWPEYLRRWPGLRMDVEIRDAFGKVIPAFRTDEDGVGVWWYWMVNRAGFGAEGEVSFQDIALKYAGATDVGLPAVANYLSSYSGTTARPGVSKLYFGRFVAPAERMRLSDPEIRWKVANTMFHHEAGRQVTLSRLAFDRGIALATVILRDGFDAVSGVASPPANGGDQNAGATCPGSQGCGGMDPSGMMVLTVGRYALRVGNNFDSAAVKRMLDVLEQRR